MLPLPALPQKQGGRGDRPVHPTQERHPPQGGGLAKSVHDAGWSAFVNMLEYKAARHGRTLHKIDRFAPTSQVCSQCGAKDGPKPLNIREWTCPACGAVLDRDTNAAVNVAKAAGLAVPACGAQVRPGPVPAQRREAGTHPKPP